MLCEDVILIIKSFAGITNLDIANAYRELKQYIGQDSYTYPRPKIIYKLLKLIPFFYKNELKDSKEFVCEFEKHFLEDFIGRYVSRTDTTIAFSLLSTKILKQSVRGDTLYNYRLHEQHEKYYFHMKRLTDCKIKGKIKKIKNLKTPAYRVNICEHVDLLEYLNT